MPPEHYEHAVARAVERISAGALDKVVLAREVQVHARGRHDPGAVLGVLREAFPQCYVLCVGRGDSAFVAASPELLVRREGLRAGTLALAGSARRSADPAVDDHLGEQLLRSGKDREEQAIVTRRIVRALRPLSVWVTAADEPVHRAHGQHPAPGHADPRAARASRSARSSSPACCTRRPPSAASRCTPRHRSSPRSRASTAAGTRAPWAGLTSTRTASCAWPCAARC